jgi:propionate CoA-transferase
LDKCLAGAIRVELSSLEPVPLDQRKVICRRAAKELHANSVVNLGLGMPETVAAVAAEHGAIESLCLTAEAGVIGGAPARGLRFGTSYNVDMMLPTSTLFDFYQGGGLDVSCLGFAQVDRFGNVGVGSFSERSPGVGGFVDIAQNAKTLMFLGTLTAGLLDVHAAGGALAFLREGRFRKFVRDVQQVNFSANFAIATKPNRRVLYITERAVFRLVRVESNSTTSTGFESGLELIELAPGVDMERDVFELMDFRPSVSPSLRPMDPTVFSDAYELHLHKLAPVLPQP